MSLVIDSVGVTYAADNGADIQAVDDFSLTVEAGQFVVVIGPSGCGKSTMLSCVGGLVRPTTGRIQFNGADIEAPDPHRGAFVFQDYGLFPWQTVVDNAALGLRYAGVKKADRRAAAMRYLELVGLADFASAYPGQLSGGMQQRVAVARALTMGPQILLLDEPFGAIDEISRRRLGVEMSRILGEAGKTVLFITHSLEEAIFWADRVIVMSSRPGRIIRDVRVEHPRPRQLEFMTDPIFDDLRSELFRALTEGRA